MPANYDYKYSDREYEVMMLKKDLKNKVKTGAAKQTTLEDSLHEMNELLDSDQEENAGDIDELANSLNGYKSFDEDDDFFLDEESLMDSDEERDHIR